MYNSFSNFLNKIRKRFNNKMLIRLSFFPIVLLITNCIRIFKTLNHSKILIKGKWSDFKRYKPAYAINSLFYWTMAINIKRYGKSGKSPFIGHGNFDLIDGIYQNFLFFSIKNLRFSSILSMSIWLLSLIS